MSPDGALRLEPEDAIGDGPFIEIALPTEFTAHVPMNATSLLREWEAQLRPVPYLVNAAKTWLRAEDVWDVTGKFVEPTESALCRVREAADEERLVDLLAETQAALGTVIGPDREPIEAVRGRPMRSGW